VPCRDELTSECGLKCEIESKGSPESILGTQVHFTFKLRSY